MKTRKKGLWKVYAIVFAALIVVQSLASGVNTVFADTTTLHCLNVWTSNNMTVYKNATETVSHPQITYASGTETPVFCIDLGKAAETGDTLTSKEQADYTRLNDKQKQAIGYVLGSNAQLTPPVGAVDGYAGADYTDTSVQQQMKWFWSTQLMIWYFIDYYDDETVDCGGMNWAGVENTCNAGWGDLTECNRIWYYVINMMRIPTFAVDYDTVSDADTPIYEMTWNNSSNQYEVILHHTDAESRVMAHYEEPTGKLHYMVCNADGTPNDNGEYLKVYTTEAIAQDSALETWGKKEGKQDRYVFFSNERNPQEFCGANGIIDAPPVWFKFKVYTAGESDLTISKKDITTQEELPGCTLSVTSPDGSITYDTWVSTLTPHPITGLETGTYVLHELIPANGYTIANDVTFSYDKASNTAQTVTMYNAKTRVELLKTDEAGNPLAGAKLEVRKADGSFVESWTSGATAHVIEGLPAGNYVLKETQAPSGYTIAADKPFTITLVNQTVTVTMADKKTRVELLKTDEAGNPLAGAKLEVRKADGTFVESWTSGATAHVIEGLSAGNYILRETQAPSGYTIAADKPFTVTSVNQTVAVTMADKKTRVELLKTDASGNPLAGAKLEVRKADGSFVESWTSGATAHVIEGLPAGNYILRETQAPSGYTLAADVPFTVTSVNQTVTVTMEDNMVLGKIRVYKTGEQVIGSTEYSSIYGSFHRLDFEQKPLEGVVFALYREDGTWIGNLTTDRNGYAESAYLEWGNYYLIEVKTKNGLVNKQEKIPVSLTCPDSYHEGIYYADITVKNEVGDTEINVYKQGEILNVEQGTYSFGKKPLPGVIFGVYTAKDILDYQNQVVLTADSCIGYIKTGADGKATLRDALCEGEYYYKEVQTIDGYILDTTRKNFTLSLGNTELNTMDVNKENPDVNKLYKARLQLTKSDSADSNVVLSGVEFQLYNEKDELMGTYVTDESGRIIIDDLPYGSYYFVETKTADGYVIDTSPHRFTADTETMNLDVTNTKQPETPKTGDSDPVGMLIALIAGAFSFGIMCFRLQKRKR